MVFNNVDIATRYNEAQQTSLQLLMKDAEISNDWTVYAFWLLGNKQEDISQTETIPRYTSNPFF